MIFPLTNKWWNEERVPEQVTEARVVSLYKKGDPDQQENYRPISLLNASYKILAAMVQSMLAKTLDKYTSKTQFWISKRKKHHRCYIHSQKIPRIRRKNRKQRPNASARLGKSF